MAITKSSSEDLIQVFGEYKSIKVRTTITIKEGSSELTKTYSTKRLECVSSSFDQASNSWTHTDTDVSSESDEVKGIAGVVWTTTVKNAKKAYNETQGY